MYLPWEDMGLYLPWAVSALGRQGEGAVSALGRQGEGAVSALGRQGEEAVSALGRQKRFALGRRVGGVGGGGVQC